MFPTHVMSGREAVHFIKAGSDLRADCRRLLRAVYGDATPWASAREVLVKPNAVNFEPHVYVDPAMIGALVAVLREDGAARVTVMESCTNGSFTRLVFAATGIARAVENAGGRCVYLDEGPSVEIEMGSAGRIRVPRFAHQRLVENRNGVFYIDLAKMKTHSMSTVTFCLKNQWAFVDPACRSALHNDFLHQSIAEVNRVFVPDLCLVEGLVATNHGHFPLRGFEGRTLWNAGVLVGGRNAVAVDAACTRFLGLDPAAIPHIARCAASPDLLDPPVVHHDAIEGPKTPFTDELLPEFPRGITVHKGRDRCCVEGCWSNPVCSIQVIAANYGGGGRFHVFMGKGHDPAEVEACEGPALVVGPCAHDEVHDRLVRRLGRRSVRFSSGHNNLNETIGRLLKLMGVSVFQSAPLPLPRMAWLFAAHFLSGSRARIGFF
ncbi:MAG: DUF362 domain-containing protein [Deltaproteobacteria bacterium]|nr:DUF362 domain-containing protein [Deltaproteobacteria bacterium]